MSEPCDGCEPGQEHAGERMDRPPSVEVPGLGGPGYAMRRPAGNGFATKFNTLDHKVVAPAGAQQGPSATMARILGVIQADEVVLHSVVRALIKRGVITEHDLLVSRAEVEAELHQRAAAVLEAVGIRPPPPAPDAKNQPRRSPT